MRLPGEQRYAVIPPYPARWFMTKLASGEMVNADVVAAHARSLRDEGGEDGPFFAAQLLGAWRQLVASAMDGEPTAPTVLRPLHRRLQATPPAPAGPDGAA